MKRCLNCMKEYPDQYEDRCPHCGYLEGATQNGERNLTAGTILQGRYIVGTVIRDRDMDVIYHGWDALFDRRVQIQEYFPKYCASRVAHTELSIYQSKEDIFRQGLELFVAQSRELIRLYRENDVVTYHACFRENKTAYAVTELRDLKTLREWSEEHHVSGREGVDLLLKAIEAVEKCQELGLYHGMIDSSAFWITGSRNLILKDFGPWKYVSGEPGVVGYGDPGPAMDVYGLAKMFCQLVTGSETEDVEKLEQELFRSSFQLKGTEAAALKNALSHDTITCARFRDELAGRKKSSAAARRKKLSSRRDAKISLHLSRWWLAGTAAAVALVIGITAVGIRHIAIRSGESVKEDRVPNIVGMDVEEAGELLESLGLQIKKEETGYDSETPEGTVSRQLVRTGARVSELEVKEVGVIVSLGAERKRVPPVMQMSEADARSALTEFSQITTEVDNESTALHGTVTKLERIVESEKRSGFLGVLDKLFGRKASPERVSVADGEMLTPDTQLILTISGHEEVTEAAKMEVPNLVEKTEDEANSWLQEHNLPFKLEIERCSDAKVAEHVIISQSPEAGAQTNEVAIKVVVSTGPKKVQMVNVSLIPLEEAKTKIESIGLIVGTVTKEYDDGVEIGKVISQSVAADTQVKKGSSVDLVVSKGEDPEKKAKREAAEKAAAEAEAAEQKRREAEARAEAEAKAAASRAAAEAEAASRAAAEAEAAKQAAAEAEAASSAAEEAEAENNATVVLDAGSQPTEPQPTEPQPTEPQPDESIIQSVEPKGEEDNQKMEIKNSQQGAGLVERTADMFQNIGTSLEISSKNPDAPVTDENPPSQH